MVSGLLIFDAFADAILVSLDNSMVSSMTAPPSRSTQQQHTPDSIRKAASASTPSISMFATPQERIVFAQTPSAKLFVALFTVPTLDGVVAK